MPKQKISVTLEFGTVSKLLERLAREKGNFSSKSELVQHAVNEFLEAKNMENTGGDVK